MGIICPKRKKKDIIIINCCFPFDDKDKKRLINEIFEKLEYKKPIKFILEPNNTFSISLNYNEKKYKTEEIKTAEEYIDEFNKIINPTSPSNPLYSNRGIKSFTSQTDITLDPINFIKTEENIGEKDNKEKIKMKKLKINNLFKDRKLLRFTNTNMQKIEILYNYGFEMKDLINLIPKKEFLKIENILSFQSQEKEIFALGLLAKNLSDNGLEIFIEKEAKENEDDLEEVKKERRNIFEFITNGIFQKTKYTLKYNFGKKRGDLNTDNMKELEILKDKLQKKIEELYELSKNEIFVEISKYEENAIDIIFLNDKYNNFDFTTLKQSNNDNNEDEMEDFKYPNNISKETLLKECIFSKNLLDSKGNNFNGNWGFNEDRGNVPYDPPIGWIGVGLKVMNLYDNGDNSWIGMENNNDWCVAYCRVGGHHKNNLNLRQRKKAHYNKHKEHEDIYHIGEKVGEGINCTPKILIAENFARIIEINQKRYKILLMVRVKNDKIRECKDNPNIWIVNGTSEEIRPYRILYKEIFN